MMAELSPILKRQILEVAKKTVESQPSYAFDMARSFFDDPDPLVATSVIEVLAQLAPDFYDESIAYVRRYLDKSAERKAHGPETYTALRFLAKHFNSRPALVFEESTRILRTFFGRDDLGLTFGHYPFDELFHLIGKYLLIDPHRHLDAVITLLEDRNKDRGPRAMLGEESLMYMQTNFGSPSLQENALVMKCLVDPLNQLWQSNPQLSKEIVQRLYANTNPFAKRAALHTAELMLIAGDVAGKDIIQAAINSYPGSEFSYSVFQTARQALIVLAPAVPRFVLEMLRILQQRGIIAEFEIAALLSLLRNSGEARRILKGAVSHVSGHFIPQILQGAANLEELGSGYLDQIIAEALARIGDSPDNESAFTSCSALKVLAKRSWKRASPKYRRIARSPIWRERAHSLVRDLVEVASVNPEALPGVRRILQSLLANGERNIREDLASDIAKLREKDADFAFQVLEGLSKDGDPSPEQDEELLGDSLGEFMTIKTVRGSVPYGLASLIPAMPDKCLEILVRLSRDQSAYVRCCAVHILEAYSKVRRHANDMLRELLYGGYLGDGLLNDPSPAVRYLALRHAFYLLVGFPDSLTKLLHPLTSLLMDADKRISGEAAQRILDAACHTRDQRYVELLDRMVEEGGAHVRHELAFRIGVHMKEDPASKFEFLLPFLKRLAADNDNRVREAAALRLEDFARLYPEETSELAEAIAFAEGNALYPPGGMGITGYLLVKVLEEFLQRRPSLAVRVFSACQSLPDPYSLGRAVEVIKDLDPTYRHALRPILNRFVANGLVGASDTLLAWDNQQHPSLEGDLA